MAVALALRLIDLGDRPFHHDESQDAYFSWIFFTEGDYEYNPLLHGPLRFYLTAGMYALFGDSDFTARLAPALMGTLMVPLPYLLRGQIGRVGAFAAAALLAFGPSYLYFSRFAREDIYFAAISLALLVVTFRFLERPRRHQPALIGALLALAFATKETTFITGFVAVTFFAGVLLFRRELLLRPLRAVGLDAWGWGLAAFLGVYTLLFTTFLTHPDGVRGLYTGLEYWLGQHEVGRGGEAWYFYLVVLFGDEWPVLLLGAVGAVFALRRPTLLRVFLIWAFAVSLVVYSWAGEKFAWLVLHPLLPLLLLAGLGVQAIWDARRRWYGWVGIAVVACRLRVRRLRLVHRQRAQPRRSARAAGLHPVLGGGQARRRRGRRARGAAADLDHRRLLGGRDLPVGVVLPRPRRQLRGARHERHPARLRRPHPHPGRARPPATPRRRRAPDPVPRLVGARLRRDDARLVVALVHRARAVEPDRRHAGMGLRALIEAPDRRPVPVEDLLAELVPLGQAGVAVGGPLDRAEDHIVDAITVDQLARLGDVGGDDTAARRPRRDRPGRGPTGPRGRASRARWRGP